MISELCEIGKAVKARLGIAVPVKSKRKRPPDDLEEIESKNAEIARLTQELDDARNRQSDNHKQYLDTVAENARLKQQLADVQDQLVVAEELNISLYGQETWITGKLNDARKLQSDNHKQYLDTVAENARLKQQLADVQDQLSQLNDNYRALQQDAATNQQVIDGLKQDAATNQQVINGLKQDAATNQQVINGLKQDAATNQQVIDGLKQDAATNQQVINGLKHQLAECKQDLVQPNQMTEGSEDPTLLQSQLHEAHIKIAQLKEELTEERKDIDIVIKKNVDMLNRIRYFEDNYGIVRYEVGQVLQVLETKEQADDIVRANVHEMLANLLSKHLPAKKARLATKAAQKCDELACGANECSPIPRQ
jgi:chromosome segregation ATPase